MAATLEQLVTLRDALQTARLGGISEVQDQSGERIKYRSDAEMASAIAAADREIARLRYGRAANVIRFNTSKGL